MQSQRSILKLIFVAVFALTCMSLVMGCDQVTGEGEGEDSSSISVLVHNDKA